jgi:hypothetical protein
LPSSERITIADTRELQQRGERVVLVDSRAATSYMADERQAVGAVRVPPEDPVRTASALRLDQHATLVIYCA